MLIIDLIREYFLIIKNFILFYIISVPKNWRNGDKGSVMLFYGLNGHWTDLRTIGIHLNRMGYKIIVIKYNSRDSIQNISDTFVDYINYNNLYNIILIAHSKGGLIARNLYENSSINGRISKCVLISTPNTGSVLGYLGLISLSELKPNSNFITDLNANSKRNSEIFNFYSKFDNHIIPNKNLLLEGAINKMLNVNGHTRIIESTILIENIKTIILTKTL